MSSKITYPSADRNKAPILDILRKHFDQNRPGKVLEIASGTGQHVSYFAEHFPNLTFQPSEYDEELLESIEAYIADTPTKNIQPSKFIDVTTDCTRWGISKDFDYVFSVNMFHVTPFSCSEGFFKNGSGVLKDGGLMVTYGPYAVDGVLEPASNVEFDRSIRRRDSECGVRDVRDLKVVAGKCGVKLLKMYEMPSNNKCLIWQKCKE